MENNVESFVNFNVSFELDGTTYKFNASDIKRDKTDGAGNPMYFVQTTDQYGRHGTAFLNPDWTINNLFVDSKFTLRNKIAYAKEFYIKKYGKLGGNWAGEGCLNTIMDYASSVPVEDFTADDWQICEENDWSRAVIEDLCKED